MKLLRVLRSHTIILRFNPDGAFTEIDPAVLRHIPNHVVVMLD